MEMYGHTKGVLGGSFSSTILDMSIMERSKTEETQIISNESSQHVMKIDQ